MLDSNCTAGQPLPLSEYHGFLANIVTEQTQLGSAGCPWLIDVEPGQTVSVSLHDFGILRHTDSALEPANPVRIILRRVHTGDFVAVFGNKVACFRIQNRRSATKSPEGRDGNKIACFGIQSCRFRQQVHVDRALHLIYYTFPDLSDCK